MKVFFQKSLTRMAIISLIVAMSGSLTPGRASAQSYENADILLSSVLGKLQYPLPTAAMSTPGGRFKFDNAKAAAGIGTVGEVDWVAAHRYCEHLVPVMPTPPHGQGRKLTIDDIRNIDIHRKNAALTAAAVDECFAAVAYRTACSKATQAAQSLTAQNTGESCYEIQLEACGRLKNPVEPNSNQTKGMGITKINDREADWALDRCEQDGLSPAMYDKIMAYRCDSESYVTGALANLKADAALWERTLQFDCPALKQSFDDKLYKEKQRLLTTIQNLIQMRGVAAGTPAPSPTARPTQ